MTIRLTSPESFDAVLEKLKRDPMYSEEANRNFFKYSYPDLRQEVAEGENGICLEIDWTPNATTYKIEMVIRYSRIYEIMTDVEYLKPI